VNEIPKGTRAKMEIATKEPNNPIKQDVKNGKLRDLTYGKMPFNYGALPQTWENPLLVDPELGLKGDNDPLDVVEISTGPLPEGSVIEIKVLGALALLDEGEVDWKIIAVDANSPLAAKLNNAGDIENVMPGVVHDIREWFRLYKTSDGKPQNVFGHKEHILGLNETKAVIAGAHAEWRSLVTGKLGAEASALGLWTDAGAAAAEAEDAAAVADSAPTTVV
jgi:inorganic pyrophosphatase